jgi:hypothetical protein
LLATYLDPEVPLAVRNIDGAVRKYQCISLWVNSDGFRGGQFIVRLNSNSLAVAIVSCDPQAEGRLSADGKWKRIVMPFAVERMERSIKEHQYFNKLDMVIEKPGDVTTLKGRLHVKGIQLHVAPAVEISGRVVNLPSGRSSSQKRK